MASNYQLVHGFLALDDDALKGQSAATWERVARRDRCSGRARQRTSKIGEGIACRPGKHGGGPATS